MPKCAGADLWTSGSQTTKTDNCSINKLPGFKSIVIIRWQAIFKETNALGQTDRHVAYHAIGKYTITITLIQSTQSYYKDKVCIAQRHNGRIKKNCQH